MSRKRPWIAKLWPSTLRTVNWVCITPPGAEPGPKNWVRTVTLTVDLDGREIVTHLTSDEARAIADRLMRQANAIDAAKFEAEQQLIKEPK